VDRLLKGKTYNFIKCNDVDYTSNKTEEFLDLQLDVMGCKGVQDSLDKICKVLVPLPKHSIAQQCGNGGLCTSQISGAAFSVWLVHFTHIVHQKTLHHIGLRCNVAAQYQRT
jgi:hypothetical protein